MTTKKEQIEEIVVEAPAQEVKSNNVKMSKESLVVEVAPQDVCAFKSAGYTVIN